MSNFFWANIRSSYQEVLNGHFLWAPAYSIDKNGVKSRNAGWEPVKKIKAGDIIFCRRGLEIIYIAEAISDAYEALTPKERKNHQEVDGYRIEIQLAILNPPLPIDDFKSTVINDYNKHCVPLLFNKDHKLCQQYMISIPTKMGKLILDYFDSQELNELWQDEDYSSSNKEKLLKGGTKNTIIKARIGQGKFRSKLLLIDPKCRVTEISDERLLIASHIKPWAESSNTERIDTNNGLLLAPHVDALFDKGLISFTDEGNMLVKDQSVKDVLTWWSIDHKANFGEFSKGQRKYLQYHREQVYGEESL